VPFAVTWLFAIGHLPLRLERHLRAREFTLQIIDDFAAYNAEGFMSTLELLPMWQNVDPDVDLFGSGVVSELSAQDSEWAAGHALSLDGPCVFPCYPIPFR
jgi:hypothetical protein